MSTIRIVISLILGVCVALLYIFPNLSFFSETVLGSARCPEELLCVHFLDVGQGDATFIEAPGGAQVLIDGGKGSAVLRALAAQMSFFDRDIDVVIATHPDQDHIGGLVAVLERFSVGSIVQTENQNDTSVADAFAAGVAQEGVREILGRAGTTLTLGHGTAGPVVLTILFPDRNAAGFESNASSIIAQLVYGETEFMLMGDAPKSIERHLLTQFGAALASDVLKVGHHGSDTSTDAAFLSAVTPTYGVISAGKDNAYGHPHHAVLDRLTAAGVITKNTADVGSVSFVSDGKLIQLDTK